MDKGEKLIKVENEMWEGIHEKLKNRETRKGLNKSRSKAMIERQLEETYKDTGIKHYDKFKNHIEYLQNCFRNGGPVKIGEAKYLVKGFSYSDYPTLGIELDLVFKEFENMKDESNKNNDIKFKPGDKVRLNRPMPSDMEKQIEYRKFYNVVVTDVMGYKGKEIQILGIEGVKGLISSEYFDLYEEDKRDFTIDELIFIQGHLGGLRGHYEEELECTLDKKRQKLLKRKVDTINSLINKISELFCTY